VRRGGPDKELRIAPGAHARWASLVPALLTSMIGGGISGAVSAVATSPMDVVRTRLQVSERAGASLRSAAQNVLRESGPRGFWNGCTARMMGMVPSTALLLTSYELLKRLCLRDDSQAMAGPTPKRRPA
jgi:hypothetical protein